MIEITAPELAASFRRGLGFVHAEYGPVASAVAMFGASRSAGAPAEARVLEGCVRRVKDQRATSSCVGQATASAIDVRLRFLGIQRPEPSSLACYSGARMLRKTKEEPLVDEGSNSHHANEWIRDVGVASEEAYLFDEEKINQELSWDVEQNASAFRTSGWAEIFQVERHRIDVLCQAHVSGYPSIFAMGVDPAFEAYSGGTIDAVDLSRIVGAHMLTSLGYRTRPDGKREFRILNSWGIEWGEDGFAWVHEDVLASPNASTFTLMEVIP